MFTGIIEDLGVVRSLTKTGAGAKLTVESKLCISGARIGDSLNINGACLTIADIKDNTLSFDISSETMKRTNLGELKAGERINIERSLRADSRLGGHFVTGHIDCTAKIVSKRPKGEFIGIEIEIPEQFMTYLVEKGSISVDGISLTITKFSNKSFCASLIPHTISVTTLGYKKAGDHVNIEVDILAKYVERLTNKSARQSTDQPTNITRDFLKEHGFV